MECTERFCSKEPMPEIGGEDVEKAQRRKDGAGSLSLDRDILIDNIRVSAEPDFGKAVDVLAIKTFIETNATEFGIGMKPANAMQGHSADERR